MGDKLAIVRLAVHLVSSVGVSKVVNDIIVKNTNIVTTVDAVKVWTGSIVIGSMVAEHASKHVNDKLNAVVAWNEDRKTGTVEAA